MPKISPALKTRQERKNSTQQFEFIRRSKTSWSIKENKRKFKVVKNKGKGVWKKSKQLKVNLEKVKKKIPQQSNDTWTSDVNTNQLCLDEEDNDAEDAGIGALLMGFRLVSTVLDGILCCDMWWPLTDIGNSDRMCSFKILYCPKIDVKVIKVDCNW